LFGRLEVTCAYETFDGPAWQSRDDLEEKREKFSGLNLDWDIPKPFFDDGIKVAV
jgi:hypothetical protein